jgi:hypothetical protein
MSENNNFINDKRPGKGPLVPVKEWCEKRQLSSSDIKKWSLKYDFYIKKIGNVEYVHERDLENALQSEIENQEAVIESRRSRARDEAALRRKIREDYFSKMEAEFKKGSFGLNL